MPLVREALRELVPVPDPAWWDSQRWRYAHPVDAANAEWLGAAGGRGLFFAGDGLVGKGRVPLAVRSGLDAAARIASRHESMAPPL
jgi:predicted NAD/FAD-dependent oxidoreductase